MINRRFLEEPILFVSILKWSFLAVCVGIVVGVSAAVFLQLLDMSIAFAGSFQYYFVFLPLALFLSAFIVLYLPPESRGHGTDNER